MATLSQPQPTPQSQDPSLKDLVKTITTNQLQFLAIPIRNNDIHPEFGIAIESNN